MYVLVEYNDLYKKNLVEIKKYGFIPVVLFKIRLNNKNQIKEDLEKLRVLKDKVNPQFSAIQIILEKIENSTVGVINNLKNYFDVVIGYGGLNKVNRYFLEQTQIDFLQNPQNSKFKTKIDFIHHFNSGINHILAKFARDRQINFIFSLNFSKDKRIICKEIGRINQNLKLMRKYKVSTLINFIIEEPSDIKSIVELRGIMSFFDMSTFQKEDSLNILEKRIKQNRFKKSNQFISEGIKVIE